MSPDISHIFININSFYLSIENSLQSLDGLFLMNWGNLPGVVRRGVVFT